MKCDKCNCETEDIVETIKGETLCYGCDSQRLAEESGYCDCEECENLRKLILKK